MSTKNTEISQDLNKSKLNTTNSINNDMKKPNANRTRTRSNSTLSSNKLNNGKTKTMVKKTAVVSTLNPSKGRPRSSSLGQNKSKSKIPNSQTTITSMNKTNTLSKLSNPTTNSTVSNSKQSIKPKVAPKVTTGSKVKSSTTIKTKPSSTLNSTISSSSTTKPKTSSVTKVSTIKPKSTSSLKSKTSSTLKTTSIKPKITSSIASKQENTLKPKISSTIKPKVTTNNVKSKTNSITSNPTAASRVKATTSTIPKKGKSTTSTVKSTPSSRVNSSINSNIKQKTTVRSTRLSSTNSRLKPSTASSTIPSISSTLKTATKPNSTLSNRSSVSSTLSSTTARRKSSSSITSRKLTTSPTPYSSQNSTTSSNTSTHMVRRTKQNPYANVKAKVNSLPSSRASSTSSTSTVRVKNSISSIANTKSHLVKKIESTNIVTKNDIPHVVVTSSSAELDNKAKKLENNRKENELVTTLSKSLQNLAKTESIGLNDITPIETPVSTSPIVAPILTVKNASKFEGNGSMPPSPTGTSKFDDNIDRSNSTNNEILDEYIKNIKYDPDALNHFDPNEIAFSDDEDKHDKSHPSSFIADTKNYDDISVTTDDFLDCESNFSDAKFSQKDLKSNTSETNNLSKVSSISNLSTISSLSTITHKSSNNSFASSVSIHTLKSIFDNAATQRRSSPVPPSTPKIKKLNPQTLQLFEKQSTPISSQPGRQSPLKKEPIIRSKLNNTNISKTSISSSTYTSPSLKPTSNSFSSVRLKDNSSPLMKAVKSRVDSNFGSIPKKVPSKVSSSLRPTLSKVSSTSSLSSLANKSSETNYSIARSKTPTGTVSRISSSSSISSMGKASYKGSLSSSTKTKTPTLSSSLISGKTLTISPKVSSVTKMKTPTLSASKNKSNSIITKTSSISNKANKSSSTLNTTKAPLSTTSKPLTIDTNVKTTETIHLSPNIPRRNTRRESLQPNSSSNDNMVVEEEYDDDDEFKDSKDDTYLISQEFSAEPESINKVTLSTPLDSKPLLNNFVRRDDDKAIPSYTVKKHTLDQSQICEISENSFILNQYVEETHYYQTKHSHNEELIGDSLRAEEIIDQVKQEEKRKEEEEALKKKLEKNNENMNDKFEPPIEKMKLNENESMINDDEVDGMSISSINVKKLLKKNISNIIKPKNLTSLIKKRSSLEMNESFESNNSFSDNASEVSGISDKRDSRGSTSYVFSMFMQSLNGANNLIKKRRNSASIEDMKITISGPYQDDDLKSTTTHTEDKPDIKSSIGDPLTPSKMVVVPLNTSIEIPKRVSSAVPCSDDELMENPASLVYASKLSGNNLIKLDVFSDSGIQSTPFKLINKLIEKNKDKHISADSAISLGDSIISITFDNLKEIINEEWSETINQQKAFSNSSMDESDGESMITLVSPSTSMCCSSRTIQNNQILKHLSMGQECLASRTEGNDELNETMNLIEKHLKKINNIICEIASTEKTYVHELSKLLEIYYYPLEQNQVLNPTEMNYLFSNIVNIYQFHSEIFYPKLDLVRKEHEKNIKLINDPESLKSVNFAKLINQSISIETFFKIVLWPFQFIYKQYYINFKKASDFVSILNSTQKQKYNSEDLLMQAEELHFSVDCSIFERENKKKLKKLRTFLKSCTERMDHNQVDILGYLILPIQRLPRYLLLLEGLAKSAKLLEETISKLPKPVLLEPILEVPKVMENKMTESKINDDDKRTPSVEKDSNETDNKMSKTSDDASTISTKSSTPKLTTPKVNVSKPSTPKLTTPKVYVSKPSTPKLTTPKVNVSKPSTPKLTTPKVNASKPSTPKLATPKVNASKPSTPKITAKKASTSKLNTSRLSSPSPVKTISKPGGNNSNKNINKLKETLNKSSNATVNSIEAKKASERTDRAKKTKINVKSIVAQLENDQPESVSKTTVSRSKIGVKPKTNVTTRTKTGVKPNTNVTSRVNSNIPKANTKANNNTLNKNKTTTSTKNRTKSNEQEKPKPATLNDAKEKIAENSNDAKTMDITKIENTENNTEPNIETNTEKDTEHNIEGNTENNKETNTEVKIQNNNIDRRPSDETDPTTIKKESKENDTIPPSTTITNSNEEIENEITKKKEIDANKKLSINTLVNEINSSNTTSTTIFQKNYTIAMAAEDIKNIIELCNKAITV
ncbi:hypothetical protein BCR36DRAFT_327604 [Piromyces finnis]|uniref:DH domain-containing protein n=1 Tax=Piromyces finnis TaxID=1754191 RepID=A0A1Y1V906_9FUNG|nr:hypothetical protein BCR36DRAFT_327604 [Piromyces finnis]|eukprot:ORX50067.1 hypothetical protein BCR36DRAFT_327604 [Piromyces finnis]